MNKASIEVIPHHAFYNKIIPTKFINNRQCLICRISMIPPERISCIVCDWLIGKGYTEADIHDMIIRYREFKEQIGKNT